MNNSWLTAYAAQQLVSERRDVRDHASVDRLQWAIIDYARTVLPARCQFMWDRVIEGDEPYRTEEFRDCNIPSWVWSLTEDMSLDWTAGIFDFGGDRNGQWHYVKLSGVEFSTTALDRIWPGVSRASTITAQAPLHPTLKASPKVWDWEPVLIDLITFAHSEGLHELELTKRGGQAKLERWLEERFARLNDGAAPSEAEIRKRASAVKQAISISEMKG